MAKTTSGAPTAEQLKIAQQLSAVISMMATQTDKITKGFENQAEATAQMAKNMEGMSTGEVVSQLVQVNETLKSVAASLEKLSATSEATFDALSKGAAAAASSTQQLTESVQEAGEAALESGSSFDRLKKSLIDSGKGAKGFKNQLKSIGDYLQDEYASAVGAALGAMSGLQQGFSNLMAMSSGIMGFFSGLVSSAWELGKSILSIPLKIFDGLIEKANSASGGVSELAEAINNLRKEFGALTGPTNTAIMGLSKSMSSLVIPGTTATQVFGNQADMMKTLTELFTQGGASIRGFTSEIVESNGALVAMQKGLGFTSEQMSVFASYARRDGTKLKKVMTDVTKYADHLGKRFGLDSKIISKGMAEAASNMATFGHMSMKQIGVATAYFQKLGIEVKDVTGLMDKVTSFDDAAESVSTLNSTLGTNIDLNEVMMAQTPDELFEVYRKGLQAAGKSLDQMSFRERAFLKQQMNVSDEMLNAMISTSNASISQKEMAKTAEQVENKTLTEAEALSKLADAMDRVFKSGGDRPKSFWDAFTGGIEKGISSGSDFMRLMKNIRAATDVFSKAGVQLGRMLVDLFPPLKDIIGGLADLFDPKVIGEFVNTSMGIIKEFFDDLMKGNLSFPELMGKIKEKFLNFFDKSAPAGRKVLNGFEEMFLKIRDVFAQALEWVMTKLGEFIKDIVEFIKSPPTDAVSGLEEGAEGFLSPIADAFREGWKVLGPALEELLGVVFEKLAGIIGDLAKKHWGKIALVLFGPAFAQAMIGALVPALGGALVKGVASMASGGGFIEGALGKITDAVGKAGSGAGASAAASNAAETLNKAGSPDGLNPKVAKNMQDVGSKIDTKTILRFLFAFAGIVAIGLIAFYVAAKMVKNMDQKTIDNALKVILAVAVESVIVAAALYVLQKSPDIDKKKLVPKLVTIGAVMVAMAALGVIITEIAGGIKIDEAYTAFVVSGLMAVEAAGVAISLALLDKAPEVGLSIIKKIGVIGLTMVALAGIGWIITEIAGSLSLEQVFTAMKVSALMAGEAAIVAMSLALLDKAPEVGLSIIKKIAAIGLVMVALAGIGWIITKIAGDLSLGDMVKAGILMAGMTVLAYVLQPLIGILIGIGGLLEGPGAVAAIAGLVALGILMIALAGIGWTITKIASDLKLEDMIKAGVLMTGMTALAYVLSPLVVVLMVVGALLAGPQALLAVGGLVAIGLLMVALAKLGEYISNLTANLKSEEVIKASNILNVVKDMIYSVKPLIGDLMIVGALLAGPQALLAAGGLVAVGGLMLAIAKLGENVTEMNASLKLEDLAKAASAMLSTITIVMAAASLVPALLVVGAILAGPALPLVIAGAVAIAGLITGLNKLGKAIIENALAINPSVVDASAKTYTAIAGLITVLSSTLKEVSATGFQQMVPFLRASSGDFERLSEAIPALNKVGLAMIASGSQLKGTGLKDSAEAYGAIAAAIVSMNKALSEVGDVDFAAESSWKFWKTKPTDFDKLGEVIPSLSTVGQAMMSSPLSGSADSLKKSAEAYGAVASGVVSINKALSEIDDVEEVDVSEFTTLTNSIPQLNLVATALANSPAANNVDSIKKAGESFAALGPSLEKLGEAVEAISSADIGNKLNSLSLNPQQISEKMGTISSFLDAILGSPLVTAANDKVQQLQALQEVIARGIIPSVKAVEDMIAAAQKIEKSLEQGIKIDLDAKLKTFASKFGKVGANGAYTVQARDVNIHVKFNVTMDARSIEPALINNSSSVIRNRLNLLMDAVQDDSSSDNAKTSLSSSAAKISEAGSSSLL